MKKLLWTSAMALTAAACMTACDDSSSGASNSIPEFKTEAALPDTCEMEVAKAGDTYFACFENKWIEVTESATVEQFKEGLDEDEIKAKLEELEDQLKPATPAKPKSSSSKKTDEDVDSSDSDEPESSASEECTGRRCNSDGKSSSSKKSGGGSGSGEGGSGEGGEGGDSSPSSATSESASSTESKCGDESYDATFEECNSSNEIVLKEDVIEVTTEWLNQTMLDNSDYGFLYDSRDHQLYRTVKIGTQTWMAQNLNYKTTEGSYCYNNEAENCEKHGRLYTWEQASNNACPTGWHLPSKNEFEVLIASADGATVFDEDNTAGAKLKASYGWPTGKNGTDDYGFSTLPGGMYYTQGSNGLKFDDSAMFWSATEGSDVDEYYSMSVKEDAALLISYLNWRAHSVRCVKD